MVIDTENSIFALACGAIGAIGMFFFKRYFSKKDLNDEQVAKIPELQTKQEKLFTYKDNHEERIQKLESVKFDKLDEKLDKFGAGHIQLASKFEEANRHTERRLENLEAQDRNKK